jgi:hypothetical protein
MFNEMVENSCIMVKNCVKTKILLKELSTKWINSQINYRHDTYFDFKVGYVIKKNTLPSHSILLHKMCLLITRELVWLPTSF